MNKLLTGEHIWQTFVNHRLVYRAWNDVTPGTQAIYDDMANQLNQDLGLCEECGERPVAPNCLLEIAGDMVCQKCCHTPTPESNPELQFMHMVQNADGTLAGAITPPAGMSLEAYQAQSTEEMSHISFVLEYDSAKYTSKTIPELQQHMVEYIPDVTGAQEHEYFITVFKDNNEIGQGWYKYSLDDSSEVVAESGAAKGLMDAIGEYVWNLKESHTHAN